MITLDELQKAALGRSRAEFVAAYSTLFLTHHRETESPTSASAGSKRVLDAFKTTINLFKDDSLLTAQPFAIPIKKKPGNPSPERISIGRALNCDLVLFSPSVSKLHAQLWLERGNLTKITDEESTHGTAVNGRKLKAGIATNIKLGDKLKFGRIELELMDAGGLYDLLPAG